MFVLGKDHHILSKPPKEKATTTTSTKLLGHHPLEGDGLCASNIYYYLWKRNHNLKGCQAIIPETVIFDGMMPRAWYLYDSKNAEIKKKGLRDVSIVAIKREFSKPIRILDPSGAGKIEHDIVAQYMYSAGYTEDGEEIVTVEFLHKDDLENFLTKRQKKGTSMLQRFVAPKGPYNGLIQAIWSPHIYTCERRFNVHKLSDYRWSKFERAVTYEGPFYYSKQAFCAPKLKKDILEMCQTVVKHVCDTEKKYISRMVLFFKVDPHDQVWLLWSNCLRLHDKLSPNRVPMNLSQQYSPPTTEVCTNWLKSSRQDSKKGHRLIGGKDEKDVLKELKVPIVPQELTHCADCGHMFERDDRYPLSIANIVKFTGIQQKHASKGGSTSGTTGPMAITLYDSATATHQPRGGIRHQNMVNSYDEDDPAYQDILMDDHHLQQRRSKDIRLCQFLFQQLDNALYEAYSHFQLTQKPFHFSLQVDTDVPVHGKCVTLLVELPNLTQLEHSPRSMMTPRDNTTANATPNQTQKSLSPVSSAIKEQTAANQTTSNDGALVDVESSPSKAGVPNSLFCVLVSPAAASSGVLLGGSHISHQHDHSKNKHKHQLPPRMPPHSLRTSDDDQPGSPVNAKKSLGQSQSTTGVGSGSDITPRGRARERDASSSSVGRSGRSASPSRSRSRSPTSKSTNSDASTPKAQKKDRRHSTLTSGSENSITDGDEDISRDSPSGLHATNKNRRKKMRKQWESASQNSSDSEYNDSKKRSHNHSYDRSESSDEGSNNEYWAERKTTIPSHLLKPLYFQIEWDSTLSLVQLQRHFQGAKLAAEIELYPPGHPRRRRLVERQRQGQYDHNDFLTADMDTRGPSSVVNNTSLSGTYQKAVGTVETMKSYKSSALSAAGKGASLGASSPTSAAAGDCSGVPSVLKHLFPLLTFKEYTYLSAEPAFLNQTIEVCASCFLIFTDVSSQDLHAFSKPKHSKVRAKVDHINKTFIRKARDM